MELWLEMGSSSLTQYLSFSSNQTCLVYRLDVPFGPPYFLVELENCFTVEGGVAKFKCKCVGNPEPEVNWYKDNEKLSESKQYTILFDADDNCVLIITHSNHDTAGKRSSPNFTSNIKGNLSKFYFP